MINVNFIIAQVLGIVATLILCISYNVKSKKAFLLISLLGDVVYGLGFIFIGSLSAGLITLTSCIQTLSTLYYEKKQKKTPIYIAFAFIIVFIFEGIYTLSSYWDIIPMLTYIWFTMVLRMDNVKSIKIMYIFPNILLTIYDIIIMAYASAFQDGFEAIYSIAIIVFEWRTRIKKLKTNPIKNATHIKLQKGFSHFNGKKLKQRILSNIKSFNNDVKERLVTISAKDLQPPSMKKCCHA